MPHILTKNNQNSAKNNSNKKQFPPKRLLISQKKASNQFQNTLRPAGNFCQIVLRRRVAKTGAQTLKGAEHTLPPDPIDDSCSLSRRASSPSARADGHGLMVSTG